MLHLREHAEGRVLALTKARQGDSASHSQAKARYVLETLASVANDFTASETTGSETVEHATSVCCDQSSRCCKQHQDVEKGLREQLHRQSMKLQEVNSLVRKCIDEAERIVEANDLQAHSTQAQTVSPDDTESLESHSSSSTNPLEYAPYSDSDRVRHSLLTMSISESSFPSAHPDVPYSRQRSTSAVPSEVQQRNAWLLDPPPQAPLLPMISSDALRDQCAPSNDVQQPFWSNMPDVAGRPPNMRASLFPSNDLCRHQQRVIDGSTLRQSVGARDAADPSAPLRQRLPARGLTSPREWAKRSGSLQRAHPSAGTWFIPSANGDYSLQISRSASTEKASSSRPNALTAAGAPKEPPRYAPPRAVSSPRYWEARRPPTPPRNRSRSPLRGGSPRSPFPSFLNAVCGFPVNHGGHRPQRSIDASKLPQSVGPRAVGNPQGTGDHIVLMLARETTQPEGPSTTKRPNWRPINDVILPATDRRPPRPKPLGGIRKRRKPYCNDCCRHRRDVGHTPRVRWDDDQSQ